MVIFYIFSAVEVFIFRKNNPTQQTQLQRFIIWQYLHTLYRGIFTDLKDTDMGLRIDIKYFYILISFM